MSNHIIGVNKHKEKYDKKILSQAINKVFLSYIKKKTLRNIDTNTDIYLNTLISKQIEQYIDDERIITDEIKKCLKNNMWILFNVYVGDFTDYNFNNFDRITDIILDDIEYKNDEILLEYTRLNNNQ